MLKSFIKNNYEFLFCMLLLILILIISISPQTYINSTFYGFSVWAKIVLPSLFVFFILTTLLQQNSKTQKLFCSTNKIFNKIYKTNGPSGYIFFMSIISGYPVGAKLISEFYLSKQINKTNAKKILAFSSTSGPMFILGSVASLMLNNLKIGEIILVSHYLATIFNGLLYRNTKYKLTNKKNKKSKNISSTLTAKTKKSFLKFKLKNKKCLHNNLNIFKNNTYKKFYFVSKKNNIQKSHLTINEIMLNTITSVLMVGGFISLSFTILEILNSLKLFTFISSLFGLINPKSASIAPLIFKGLLELTNGCLTLSYTTINTKILCVLLTALITFGGVSIHLQSNIFLSKCNIKYSYFLLTKITQTIISIIISTILSFVLL